MKLPVLAIALLILIEEVCVAQTESFQERAAAFRQNVLIQELARERQKAIETGKLLFGNDEQVDGEFIADNRLKGKDLDAYQIGDFGISDYSFTALNTISKTEFLAFSRPSTGPEIRVVLFRGFDTSKVTDGVVFVIQKPLVITETYTYKSNGGDKKTVLVLEHNKEKIKKVVAEKLAAIAAELAAKEALLTRKWTGTKGGFNGNARFLKFANNNVFLRKEDGSVVQIPMVRLSQNDQKWIREELKRWTLEDRSRNAVVAARAEAEAFMKAKELTAAECECVAAYVKNQGKMPSELENNTARIKEIISGREIKEWVRAETEYQRILNPKQNK